MPTTIISPITRRRRMTRRHFLATMAAGLGSAAALAVTGCRQEVATRPAPPPAPADRLGVRQPTATPEPAPARAGSASERLPIARLILKGIEWDRAGSVVKVFGFDPETAWEVLFPVTKTQALPADYAPRDLVSPSTYGVPGGQPVRAILGADLAAMQRASGDALSIVSGYRPYQYQADLFDRYVAEQMAAGLDRNTAVERVSRSSALPGHSEHQLGLAIDLNSVEDDFADTRTGRWLYQEAWRYGFALSYTPRGEARTGYQYEPWHYRWIGRPLAQLLAEQGYLEDGERTPADYYEAIRSLLV